MRRLLRDEDAPKLIADINMTNLVDVTLTLLILFILIAPVIEQGMTLELPTAKGGDLRTVDAVTVTVDRAGAVFLEGKPVGLDELTARVAVVAERDAATDVVILADRVVDYGRVIAVMESVRRGGLTRLSLATGEGEPGR